MLWQCGAHALDLSQPKLMGIVNVTPDSFSDGGLYAQSQAAIAHGLKLWQEGANILDIGGESSRPGATPVSLEEEITRVIPVITALSKAGCVISIDTVKPEVMQAALAAGAVIVNDINALESPAALHLVANSNCGVVLMHKQGEPQTMQTAPQYANAVQEVMDYLAKRLAACLAAGIAKERIVIDPGIGFGKTFAHNLAIMQNLEQFTQLAPVLLGVSRKRFIAQLQASSLEEAPEKRIIGSITAGLQGLAQGASLLRVHDVLETKQALTIFQQLSEKHV